MPTGARFTPPVQAGFDEAAHQRNWRALKEFLAGPFRQGMSRARVRQLTDQTGIATATDTTLDFASVTVDKDTDRYVEAASDRLRVPFDGQYLVIANARWEANANGIRKLFAQSSPDGSVWTDLIESGLYDSRMAVDSGTTPNLVTGVVSLARFEYLRFRVRQSSGANRTLEDWNATAIYLGPS